MQWIEGPVALRRRLDHLQPTPVRCWESSYGFVTTRKLLARCGARMPLTNARGAASPLSVSRATLIMGLLLEFDFQKLRPYPTSQKALNPALFCLIFACVVRPYRVRSDY